MTSSGDEARIEYLAGDRASVGELDDADRHGLDAVRSLLADGALWEEPPRGLGDRIVAATSGTSSVAPGAGGRAVRRWMLPFAAGAAAAAAVAVVVVAATSDGGDHYPIAATASLAPGPDAPAGTPPGSLVMRVTASGLRIDLEAPGLPGLFGGSVYECWVHTAASTQSCGTFHTGGDDIVLWSGVRDPATIESIGITLEPAGDTDPGSSGVRVLGGPVRITPAG